MYSRGARAYKRSDIQSLSQTQILDRLYLRLIEDINDTKRAIMAEDIKAKAAAITHAHLILAQLKSALDLEQAPELCVGLLELYGFVDTRLTNAGLRLDATLLDAAIDVIADLRGAFKTAASSAA